MYSRKQNQYYSRPHMLHVAVITDHPRALSTRYLKLKIKCMCLCARVYIYIYICILFFSCGAAAQSGTTILGTTPLDE